MIERMVDGIVAARGRTTPERAVLAAVSGIDGCGKGWVTAQVVAALEARGLRVAGINIDGWLNLPHVRFSTTDPAEHFYLHAIRFDELFVQLVLPLQARRSLTIDADFAAETATAFVERALARGQEGLPVEETVRAYRTIYFPAQQIHFVRDEPRQAATTVIVNDPRLAG